MSCWLRNGTSARRHELGDCTVGLQLNSEHRLVSTRVRTGTLCLRGNSRNCSDKRDILWHRNRSGKSQPCRFSWPQVPQALSTLTCPQSKCGEKTLHTQYGLGMRLLGTLTGRSHLILVHIFACNVNRKKWNPKIFANGDLEDFEKI